MFSNLIDNLVYMILDKDFYFLFKGFVVIVICVWL